MGAGRARGRTPATDGAPAERVRCRIWFNLTEPGLEWYLSKAVCHRTRGQDTCNRTALSCSSYIDNLSQGLSPLVYSLYEQVRRRGPEGNAGGTTGCITGCSSFARAEAGQPKWLRKTTVHRGLQLLYDYTFIRYFMFQYPGSTLFYLIFFAAGPVRGFTSS